MLWNAKVKPSIKKAPLFSYQIKFSPCRHPSRALTFAVIASENSCRPTLCKGRVEITCQSYSVTYIQLWLWKGRYRVAIPITNVAGSTRFVFQLTFLPLWTCDNDCIFVHTLWRRPPTFVSVRYERKGRGLGWGEEGRAGEKLISL